MAAYWAAKAQLFAWPGLRAAVVNLDDARGAELARAPRRHAGRRLDRLGARRRRACAADEIRHDAGGLAFTAREGEAQARVETPLIGDFNVANVLAVLGVLRALGDALGDAAAACAALTPVPGRMQRVAAQAADDAARGRRRLRAHPRRAREGARRAAAARRARAAAGCGACSAAAATATPASGR